MAAANRGWGQTVQPSEYRLKAAFVFNFAKFVEWPPEAFTNATAPIVIGILGDNPFGQDLEETVNAKTVNDRPFEIREFHSATDARKCHILFICTSEKDKLSQIFDALRDTNVLTVGETDGFTDNGGMINFVRQGTKIRFQINADAAKAARLKISSKLMSLALTSAH
jgi:hypothetical protein